MKGTFCVLLFLMANCSALAQEYLWPTDASQYLTSSFSESRPRRFHAGIDIKTWNQVGYKVFAVRSGYIERMAVSPFGYGRVLYLRLDTGEVAVYAHLLAFNEKLQAIADEEQERVGRYRIEKFFRPNVLPVAPGEVIAYTGQSGIGVPHLHFELRDARQRPINPFLKGIKIVDNTPPTITALAISPLAAGAMVNGDFAPVILHPRRQNGIWRIPEIIHISGKAGVAVEVYDRAEGAENRFGIYRLQLFVDDSLQFQAQYDRFDYNQNKLSELDRDFLLKRRGWGKFHRLHRVTGNILGFYSHLNSTDGALMAWPDDYIEEMRNDEALAAEYSIGQTYQPLAALSWGEHRLRVVVEDFWRNRSIVEADLLVGAPLVLTPQVAESHPNRLLIKLTPPPERGLRPATREIRKVEAAVANRNGRTIISAWRPIVAKWKELNPALPATIGATSSLADTLTGTEIETVKDDSSNVSASLQPQQILELQIPTSRDAPLVQLVAIDQYGLRSHPAFIFTNPPRTAMTPLLINVERDFYPNYLRLLIRANQPLSGAPKITFSVGEKYVQAQCIPQQPYRYVASVPLAEIAGDSVHLEVVTESQFGQQETWEEWFMNAAVQPGRGRSLFAPDARMRVAFSDNSVYSPLYGRVSVDTLTHIGDRRVIGPIYHVEPQDVPLSSAAVVTISYPDTIAQPRQLGVCYRDHDEWVFIDNQLNPMNQTVSARVFSLEDFAIIRDSEPPVLTIQTPGPGAVTHNRRPLISVSIYDSTSGFESEEAIELHLDGQRLIAEYDPERDVVQYRPKKDLMPGIHKLTARAEDRCGNEARAEAEFTVR